MRNIREEGIEHPTNLDLYSSVRYLAIYRMYGQAVHERDANPAKSIEDIDRYCGSRNSLEPEADALVEIGELDSKEYDGQKVYALPSRTRMNEAEEIWKYFEENYEGEIDRALEDEDFDMQELLENRSLEIVEIII